MKKEKLILRQNIVKLHKKSKTQTDIAYLLDIPQSTVSYWIIRYKKTGTLEDKPRPGKTPKLDDSQFRMLKESFLEFPPARYGGETLGWTTKMAIDYIKDKCGVAYSMRRMQELFHKFGLNLITPRPHHRKGSYAARTVYRMDFKKNSKKNIWVAPSLISTR